MASLLASGAVPQRQNPGLQKSNFHPKKRMNWNCTSAQNLEVYKPIFKKNSWSFVPKRKHLRHRKSVQKSAKFPGARNSPSFKWWEKKTSFTATTLCSSRKKKENLRFQERKSVNLISTEAWNRTASDFPKLQGFSSLSAEWCSLHKIMYTVCIQTRRTLISKVYIWTFSLQGTESEQFEVSKTWQPISATN